MIIQQQGPCINLDKMNQLKFDNLIPRRNQFSTLRYEVISESLFFENKKIIDEAVTILSEHKASMRPNEMNDYIPVAAKRFCSQLDQFTFHFCIDTKQLSQFDEQKSVLPISELKQIIKENLDEGGLQGYSQSNEVTPNQRPIVQTIVLELGFQELQEFQNTKLFVKEEFILQKLRRQLIIEADNFWTNNDFLIIKYQRDIQLYQTPKNQILILLKGKKVKIEDYIQFLERDFCLPNNKLIPCQFYQSQGLIPIKPVYECARLHSNVKMLNCIQAIQQLERQSRFERIQSILVKQFNQLTSFETFQQLLQLIDHAKSIIKWEHLLKIFFQQHEGYQRLSITGIQKKSNQNLLYLHNYLNSCYISLQGRFQDNFYNFADENQLQQFVDAPPFIINNNILDQTHGNCAYETFPDGIILYFKLALNQEIGKDKDQKPIMGLKRFSCYSLLSYSKQNLIKEGGELGQLILADKDEKMKVYKQNFELRQQYADAMNTILGNNQTDREIKKLIIDILLRVVAVRMKRIIFNPLTREKGDKQIYEI